MAEIQDAGGFRAAEGCHGAAVIRGIRWPRRARPVPGERFLKHSVIRGLIWNAAPQCARMARGQGKKRWGRMLRFGRSGPGGPGCGTRTNGGRNRSHGHWRVPGCIPVLAFDEHELRAFMRAARLRGHRRRCRDRSRRRGDRAVCGPARRRVVLPDARDAANRHRVTCMRCCRPTSRRSSSRAGSSRLLELRATDTLDGELELGRSPARPSSPAGVLQRQRHPRHAGAVPHPRRARAGEGRRDDEGTAAGRSVAALGPGRRRASRCPYPSYPYETGTGSVTPSFPAHGSW